MRKPVWTAGMVGALVLGHMAWGQHAHAEPGLPDAAAVATALDANPSVRAAMARAQAAHSEAGALAAGPHETTLTTSYVRRTIEAEGRFNEYDAQLTRPFRLPGKARLDRQIGRFGITAAENRAEDARHQAALILAQSWWDWLAASALAEIDQQAVINYQALAASVRRRAQLRDAAGLEVDQAEAALGGARAAAERSAGRQKLARARLAARFPALPLPDSAPAVPNPDMPAAALAPLRDHILSRSHEIAAAEAEASRQAALAQRMRADRLADPALGVRLFSERGGAEKGAGLVFSMSFGGSHRAALADRAVAEAGAARAEADAARMAIAEVASGDLAETQFMAAAWARLREGLAAQMAALAKVRRGHQAGEFGLADLLLAERQVHDAFRAEAEARTEAMRAYTRLRIDSHSLWIGDADDVATGG